MQYWEAKGQVIIKRPKTIIKYNHLEGTTPFQNTIQIPTLTNIQKLGNKSCEFHY